MGRAVLSIKSEARKNSVPALRLAALSLVLCGLVFPLIITGLAQVLMPSQADGSIVQFNGRPVGSQLIAQSFTNASLFHPRNTTASASGVDPDITLDDALSQVPRISNATGITASELMKIVNDNTEGTLWIFGEPYVNVLKVNLILIQTYPSHYKSFQ
jgi:potassium-transporting ATPase KdpC subunit